MKDLSKRAFLILFQKSFFIFGIAIMQLLLLQKFSYAYSEVIQISSNAEKRVALVMGNATYEHLPDLRNPKNDAIGISASLAKLGFTVIDGINLTRADMLLALQKFVDAIADSDVGLFYYAGHAIEISGTSYLIPVNANMKNTEAISQTTINLSTLLNFVIAKERKSIVLLDASRNNPFSNKANSLGSASVGSSDGELLMVYATAPGGVVSEGKGQNSPFTGALLKYIATPGIEVEKMLKRVRRDVFKATDGIQIPWSNSTFGSEFYFSK